MHEGQTREEQADFRADPGFVYQILTATDVRMLQQHFTFKTPMIIIFLDIQTVFDSVDKSAL